MEATELNIEVVRESRYWVVLFEKIRNNKRFIAKKRLGTEEPRQSELSKFFANLNYKRLRYVPV
jgi:hypothetical protein